MDDMAIPHEHRWVGNGDYGGTETGYMCADCGADANDEPLMCHWCGEPITSESYITDYINGESDAIYCNKECEIEAAKAERTGEWMSL